jgi:hypothetical protein
MLGDQIEWLDALLGAAQRDSALAGGDQRCSKLRCVFRGQATRFD